jgi:V8-like Glu-specific endopeptidase
MRYLLPLLLLLAGCGGCASVPSHDDLRATTLRLEFERGLCSGTAIAPDVVLTASHCWNGGGKLVKVNGQPVQVTGIGRDKHDTMTIRVTGVRFTHIAHLGNLPKQGDRLRWWGNPLGNPDVYRQGYVSRADGDVVVLDATICRGDSGAGLFTDAGLVIGVVTGMSDDKGCTFLIAFPLAVK